MNRRFPLFVSFVAVFIATVGLMAHVNGAIFTTVADGTTVNGNIYQSKFDVYLNGGPQNENGSGLSPDGQYYFQVTDPSGAVLLSTDPIDCRMVVVSGGRITNVASAPNCAHSTGAFNSANGTLPVQLMPFLDTPNHGGEYKAWLTPVEQYGDSCKSQQGSFGFCDSWSKTDNFKVRASAPQVARVTACKFNDYNADGQQGQGEPFIAHWPITAEGVDGGTITAQTGDDGCTTFAVSDFTSTKTSQRVVLSEGSFGPDWTQTAPTACGTTANCSVDGGVITLTVTAGDDVQAPSFGNTNPYCQDGCDGGDPISTATAFSSLVRTFTWTIAKSVDQPVIKTSSLQASPNYTVTLTHDNGTDSDWRLAGEIRVANPGHLALNGLVLTATAGDGACVVTDGDQATIAAGSHRDFAYRCAFPALPAPGAVNISGIANGIQLAASAPFDFASAVVAKTDAEVAVNDTMAGDLGVVTVDTPSPVVFSYSRPVSGQAGTCVVSNNIASFVTNTTSGIGEASQSVKVCVGANLGLGASATTSRETAINKSVDRSVVQQQGGAVTFNYTIAVSQRAWRVAGTVSVINPNDWQDLVTGISLAVPGAACVVSTPSVNVPASSSVDVPFSCDFASAPAASVTASVTMAWDAAAAATTESSAHTTATSSFALLTVLDAFNGGVAETIGTIGAPAALTSFTNTRTVANAAAGRCSTVTNVASLAGLGQSSSQTAYACNTITGARTIGFWQNKNGQGIITAGATSGSVCNAATWLRQFAPFQDLAATANCKTVASYATTIIKSASAAGVAMNAMLKAQMLATALDVYFSDALLGGNALAAPVPVGSVRVDLAGRGQAFGINDSLTVLQMLSWQNTASNAGGSVWYANAKAVQELAKTAFDQINNEIAPIAR